MGWTRLPFLASSCACPFGAVSVALRPSWHRCPRMSCDGLVEGKIFRKTQLLPWNMGFPVIFPSSNSVKDGLQREHAVWPRRNSDLVKRRCGFHLLYCGYIGRNYQHAPRYAPRSLKKCPKNSYLKNYCPTNRPNHLATSYHRKLTVFTIGLVLPYYCNLRQRWRTGF